VIVEDGQRWDTPRKSAGSDSGAAESLRRGNP
jgi:hypothetical protein